MKKASIILPLLFVAISIMAQPTNSKWYFGLYSNASGIEIGILENEVVFFDSTDGVNAFCEYSEYSKDALVVVSDYDTDYGAFKLDPVKKTASYYYNFSITSDNIVTFPNDYLTGVYSRVGDLNTAQKRVMQFKEQLSALRDKENKRLAKFIADNNWLKGVWVNQNKSAEISVNDNAIVLTKKSYGESFKETVLYFNDKSQQGSRVVLSFLSQTEDALGIDLVRKTLSTDFDGTFTKVTTTSEDDAETIHNEEVVAIQFVDEKPTFNGGDLNAFQAWVERNLQYPDDAKKDEIQGRVTVGFVVHTDGSISDIKVMRGLFSSLDKEAIRVISSSPKWTPGKKDGHRVATQMTCTVKFQLL